MHTHRSFKTEQGTLALLKVLPHGYIPMSKLIKSFWNPNFLILKIEWFISTSDSLYKKPGPLLLLLIVASLSSSPKIKYQVQPNFFTLFFSALLKSSLSDKQNKGGPSWWGQGWWSLGGQGKVPRGMTHVHWRCSAFCQGSCSRNKLGRRLVYLHCFLGSETGKKTTAKPQMLNYPFNHHFSFSLEF